MTIIFFKKKIHKRVSFKVGKGNVLLTWNVKNVHLEFVWIQLIFAENWKYYSKIIFKCANSIVKPIFNEKVTKKWSLWDLWIMYRYIVNKRIVKSHSLKKKKKSANRKMPTHNVDPNPTLAWVWEAHFARFPMLYFLMGFVHCSRDP